MSYEQMGYFSLFFLITGFSIMFGLMIYEEKFAKKR